MGSSGFFSILSGGSLAQNPGFSLMCSSVLKSGNLMAGGQKTEVLSTGQKGLGDPGRDPSKCLVHLGVVSAKACQ